jgi:hypothetical protein
MKVQLILFPQNYKGAQAPLAEPPDEMVVRGDNMGLEHVQWATQFNSAIPPYGLQAVQHALDHYTTGSGSPLTPNSWDRYARLVTNQPTYNYNGGLPSAIRFVEMTGGQCGLLQQLSNLTPGSLYNFEIDITSTSTAGASDPTITFYHCTHNVINGVYPFSGTGLKSAQFTAVTPDDIILIDWMDSVTPANSGKFNSVSVKSQTTINNYIDYITNGQVICDLYDDEDIPMTFSIDDFKNVAEQVKSYSKAFMLPGTKRNNRIFDLIFDVTRNSYTSVIEFNPYMKTHAILKQDGFLLFEGYLRMIDIIDKEGEISYNVNLYSEVVALADLLKNRDFNDLDFTELRHEYKISGIKDSWEDNVGLPLLNSLPTSSFAYDAALGVDNTGVLKYPFVDWAHEYAVAPITSTPVLLNLDNTFRPWLQLKYLIDKIFEPTPFSYDSSFFDTSDFKKLFMDFNWESRTIESGSGLLQTGDPATGTNYTGAWLPIPLYNDTFPSSAGWSGSPDFKFVSSADGTTYHFTGDLYFANTAANVGVEWRWDKYDSLGNVTQTGGPYAVWGNSAFPWNIAYTVDFQISLDAAEELVFRFFNTAGAGQINPGCVLNVTCGTVIVGTDVLAQSLRGDLNQWDFLKGIMTMFNLVSLPDESDSTRILIEPYSDVFIKNTSSGTTTDLTLASRSVEHDWTEKMDITENKLAPLTNLNRTTKFVWEIDDEDYFWSVYRTSTGHDYGSLTFNASGFNILEGEEEISGSPFAATLSKPIMTQYSTLIVPTIYAMEDDGSTKGFENSPRIAYNNGKVQLPYTYFIPAQNGEVSENQDYFLQFSHLTEVPSVASSNDFLWGEQQYAPGLGNTVVNNLFNRFWLPYYDELYNADTKTMTMKIKLTPADIERFRLYDTVFLKQREYRVNKIDYKPHDLSTVEFILIP